KACNSRRCTSSGANGGRREWCSAGRAVRSLPLQITREYGPRVRDARRRQPALSRTQQQIGQLGLFRPSSDWRPPSELPDLRGRPAVALDTETRDDGLAASRGPGWALGPAGYICGVSYAADGVKGYLPIRHPETENFPVENVLR